MSATVKLNITDMTCDHCVKHTQKALESVTGVENVEVSLQPGTALVTGDADPAQLIDAVKDAGYSAKIG